MRTIIPHTDNPVLREQAHEIPREDITAPRIRTLVTDMKKLLAREKFGVALAAPQVGEPLRLFIVSGRALVKHAEERDDEDAAVDVSRSVPEDQVYINPVLLKMSRGKKEKHEGCLSVRGKWGDVPRAEKATIKAYDEHGRVFTRGASGFLAHIFQHEMDHLEGILYIDKAAALYDDEEKPHDEHYGE